MIRAVKFEAWHYVVLFEKTMQFSTGIGLPDPVKIACRLAEDGRAYSGVTEKNELVGCAGILIPWAGRGIAWAMLDKALLTGPARDRIGVQRHVRRLFEVIIAEEGLVRVEADVQPSFTLAHAWVKALGFVPESEMPEFRNGETFTRYVRLVKHGGGSSQP